ncbi:MAG: alkaline phosphatase D family protein [Actinomycetota bacterium]|nr:alkaline phosphatase D family protein [Actinomycetota bacterium]
MVVLFRHGVASGEPSLTSVSLWTRVSSTEPEVPLTWVMEPDGADVGEHRSSASSGHAIASFLDDHTVTVVADELMPGTWYRYWFEGPDGARSPTARTRTLPADASPFRIGFTCCARYGLGYFTAYRMLAEEGCDLIVHLGDYVYEDAESWVLDRSPDPAYEARTLGDYRRRYAQHRGDTDVQALHHAAPMVPVWDDHDVADGATGDSDIVAMQRRQDGQQVWREWLPTNSRRGADDAIDRVIPIAGLVDLVVFDARFSGRHPHGRSGPRLEPNQRRQILADTQWDLLETTLRSSTAPWRILANQVQIGPMRLGYLPSIRRLGLRPVVNPDQWDGYAFERRRLYDLLVTTGPSLLVSGDLHSTWYRTLRHEGRRLAHELTVTSVSGETYAEAFKLRTGVSPRVLERLIRRFNDGIRFLDLYRHGYAIADISAERLDVTAVLLDTVAERSSGAERVALGRLAGQGTSAQ